MYQTFIEVAKLHEPDNHALRLSEVLGKDFYELVFRRKVGEPLSFLTRNPKIREYYEVYIRGKPWSMMMAGENKGKAIGIYPLEAIASSAESLMERRADLIVFSKTENGSYKLYARNHL